MEERPMCRICLVENVRMYAVVEKNMQDLYESLTDIPFITEDSRPTLACVFCYAKLKQCCQLQRQCLQAEELFAQMMKEANPSVNRGQLKLFNAFVKSQVVNISIVGLGDMECIAIKEELPVYYDGPEDIIEPKEEHQSDDLTFENIDGGGGGYSDVEETALQHSVTDLAITVFKTEVEEEQQVLEIEDTASDTTRASAAENPKEDTQRITQDRALIKTMKESYKWLSYTGGSPAAGIRSTKLPQTSNLHRTRFTAVFCVHFDASLASHASAHTTSEREGPAHNDAIADNRPCSLERR
ncbi:hypothetical protein PYW07_012543 [Mythimna separata]|uniref:ZAD domain-containing protein n=1 Tax=Mythimna separata TaxID=271217 RepID=A0AAD7Y8B8_MYTSE|nr:hypothetical protein PYW07_012543 [Mythimna separata]